MTGRRSIEETNKIRASLGLSVVPKAKRAPAPATLRNATKQRSQEILAVMLSKKGKAVIQRILDKALDDDDSDQMACLKMCMDRMMPVSYFEKDKAKGSGGISINITGIGQEVISVEESDVEPLDAELVED